MTDLDRLDAVAERAIDHGTPFVDVDPATIRSLVAAAREPSGTPSLIVCQRCDLLHHKDGAS